MGQKFDAFMSDIRRRYKYFVIDILLSDCCPTHPFEMSDDVGFWCRNSGSNLVVTKLKTCELKLGQLKMD